MLAKRADPGSSAPGIEVSDFISALGILDPGSRAFKALGRDDNREAARKVQS